MNSGDPVAILARHGMSFAVGIRALMELGAILLPPNVAAGDGNLRRQVEGVRRSQYSLRVTRGW